MRPVLIVDDDEATQQLLTTLMRRNGFGSVVVSNGAEAIDVLATTDFGVIILDLMLPAVDGQAVIDFVSRERENLPVIVCTAAGPRRTDAIDNKVVKAILRKPFDIDQLSHLVAALAT